MEFPASSQPSIQATCLFHQLSQQHQRPKPARLLRMSGTIGTECPRWPDQPVVTRPDFCWRHLGEILLDRSNLLHPKGSSWYGGWWCHDDHLTISGSGSGKVSLIPNFATVPVNSRLAHAAAPFGCHSQEGTRHESLHHLKLYVLVSTQGQTWSAGFFAIAMACLFLGLMRRHFRCITVWKSLRCERRCFK